MLLRIIAIIFLIIFVIRLFSLKTIPYLQEALRKIFDFLKFTFKLWLKSSLYTINLLVNRTVYIIGLDILLAVVFNFILTSITSSGLNIKIWFKLYFNNLFNVYIFSFIFFTYLIGLFTYLKNKENFKFTFKKFTFFNTNKNTSGTYTYDEKTNEYIYHD